MTWRVWISSFKFPPSTFLRDQGEFPGLSQTLTPSSLDIHRGDHRTTEHHPKSYRCLKMWCLNSYFVRRPRRHTVCSYCPKDSSPGRPSPLALFLKAETLQCYSSPMCRDVCGLHDNKPQSLKNSYVKVNPQLHCGSAKATVSNWQDWGVAGMLICLLKIFGRRHLSHK